MLKGISFREAESRYANKKDITDLTIGMFKMKDDILAAVEKLTEMSTKEQQAFDERVRTAELSLSNLSAAIALLQKPTAGSIIMQQIIASVISSLLTAIIFGSLAAWIVYSLKPVVH
jgi:hypothetical protein